MAEDRVEPRELNWRQLLPWTVLFQGFRVALDPGKLLLAAAGILLMSFGWWLLSLIFYSTTDKPRWDTYVAADYGKKDDETPVKTQLAWDKFTADRAKWNVLHSAAGPGDSKEVWEAEDFASTPAEADALRAKAKEVTLPPDARTNAQVDQLERDGKITKEEAKVYKVKLAERKPAGRLRTLPWNEDRGPNPALLVSGQAGTQWERGHFPDWLLTEQLPVLIEPLVKLFLPVKYFFQPQAGAMTRLYALLVLLWTLLVWGLFGGAITRIAAVQVARQEKIGLWEALRFALRKYLSYVSAPIFPLLFVGLLLVFMIVFGWLFMIPWLGDVVIAGLFWPLMIVLGLAMAVVLVGLVGWPLMAATISTEGTDSWEAVSRSYSYVYQAPWQYLWSCVVALAYGAVIVFFVGFMGSLMVYLSKWGISQTPGIDLANRNPSFLFVYAPKSFGWRELLLQGPPIEVEGKSLQLVQQGEINQANYDAYLKTFSVVNHIGAVLVGVVWIGLIFLLILGFGYSYFWSASTIIYLLMRRKVDDAELDEVYLEDEDEGPYAGPLAPPKPEAPAQAAPAPVGGTSLPMVEPPRPAPSPVTAVPPAAAPAPQTAVTPPPAAAPPPTPPAQGDGNTSPGTGGVP
jgi:hypothetical protein